jgi:hypothetical protein
VFAHDREQIAEQRPLVAGEVLGDLVDRGGRAAGLLRAELDVPAAIRRRGCPLRR